MWRPADCRCGDHCGDRGGGMSGRACWGGRACCGGQACCGGWGGGWLRCGAGRRGPGSGGRGPGSGRPGSGSGCPGSGGYGWSPASAGCWSQGISDSFHRRCEVCHGDRSTGAFRDPGPGRRGGRPGPPGRPRSARVGLTTGSAARMDRREGPGRAGADPFSLVAGLVAFAFALFVAFALLAAGWAGSSMAGASGSAAGSGSSMPSYQEMGDSPGSGAGDANHSPVTPSSASAVCGLSAGLLAGERRNQPAGGDTPGKSSPSLAGSASAGVASGRSASWAAACGAIRPGGTDQGDTTWSGQTGPEVPARCGSSADPGS